VAATSVAAFPILVLGSWSLLRDGVGGLAIAAGLTVAIVALGARPIRLGPLSEVSLATVPTLGGAFVLPLLAIAPIASVAQVAAR